MKLLFLIVIVGVLNLFPFSNLRGRHSNIVSAVPTTTKTEYCEWETFNASCTAADETIIIRSARYGRMKIGECITSNYGHLGCSADVSADFERACSGRRRCQIGVISLHDRRSCPKDFKSYLEVRYDCIRGCQKQVGIPRTTYSCKLLQRSICAANALTDWHGSIHRPPVGRTHWYFSVIVHHMQPINPENWEPYSFQLTNDLLEQHNIDTLDFLINGDDKAGAASQTTTLAATLPPTVSVTMSVKKLAAEAALTGIVSSAIWREATDAMMTRSRFPNKLPVAAYPAAVESTGQGHDDPISRSYRVRVAGHQRINVSIVDFAIDETLNRGQPVDTDTGRALPWSQHSAEYNDTFVSYLPHCTNPLATIVDCSADRSLKSSLPASVCNGGRSSRTVPIYVSTSNCVEIWINVTLAASRDSEFFITYEAFGCPPVVAPTGTWTQYDELILDRATPRSSATVRGRKPSNLPSPRPGILGSRRFPIGAAGDASGTASTAVVRCNETTEAWYLICRGSQWVGTVGNCSSSSAADVVSSSDWSLEEVWSLDRLFTTATNFPIGIAIVLTLGVAIGATFGAIMLMAVIAYMRRRYRHQNRRKVLKEFGLNVPEVACAAGANVVKKTSSENDTAKFRQHHQNRKRRARSLQPDTLNNKSEVPATTSRGSSNFGAVSWQRLRPLPIPGADDTNRFRGPPEMHQPLLSSSSPVSPFDLTTAVPVLTVSHTIRESSFQPLLSAAGSGRRRPNDVIDSSPTFRPQNARAWLYPPPPPAFPPPLPPTGRPGDMTAESGGDASPYYFKLDPALTRRARRLCRTGSEMGNGLSDCGIHDTAAPVQLLHHENERFSSDTSCYFCEPDI